MSRRRFLLLSRLIAIGAAIRLTGCGDTTPLTLACHVWPGYEFLSLAAREGWLDSNLVKLRPTGSATESLRLLEQDQVEGAAITLDEVLLGRAQGIPLTVVML